VSRVHARLELAGDRWTIVDAKSRNGLSVGGHRVESAPLADGDEFTLGEVLLRFRADSVAPAPVPVREPPPAPARTPIVLEEEIELEGDWSGGTGTFPTARPLAETAVRPSSAPTMPPVPPVHSAEPLVAAPRAATVPRAPSTVDRSRPVLQYQRVAQREGVLNAELSQLPLWARLGLYGLAAMVAAAIFFVAFKGTLFLKERAPGNDSELPGTGE
jgi:predicted component of type VI protein secretion system